MLSHFVQHRINSSYERWTHLCGSWMSRLPCIFNGNAMNQWWSARDVFWFGIWYICSRVSMHNVWTQLEKEKLPPLRRRKKRSEWLIDHYFLMILLWKLIDCHRPFGDGIFAHLYFPVRQITCLERAHSKIQRKTEQKCRPFLFALCTLPASFGRTCFGFEEQFT